GYGVSWAAVTAYESMIQEFSPREVSIMIGLARSNTSVGKRIQDDSSCRTRFIAGLKLIDRASVPSGVMADYDKWTQ
ncbi:MAG: hypothetical protein ACREFE_13865, partial [Limisphaerales bacterium]